MAAAGTVLVRAADPGDASDLAQLRYRFRTESDAAAEPEPEFLIRSTAWMREQLRPGAARRCWVAVVDGRLAGTLWLSLVGKLPNPNAHPEWHGYLSSFYVIPELRNRRIGSRLMTACLRACDELGVDAIFLWPTPRSRPFYERCGFGVRDDLMERRPSGNPQG